MKDEVSLASQRDFAEHRDIIVFIVGITLKSPPSKTSMLSTRSTGSPLEGPAFTKGYSRDICPLLDTLLFLKCLTASKFSMVRIRNQFRDLNSESIPRKTKVI